MLILLIVLLLVFGVGGYGFNAGWYGGGNPLGLVVLIAILLLLFGGVGYGHYGGGYW